MHRDFGQNSYPVRFRLNLEENLLTSRDEWDSLNFVNGFNGFGETPIRKTGAGLPEPGAGFADWLGVRIQSRIALPPTPP